MHGCSDASIVYGFNIGNREYIINQDWMEEFYPKISLYAMDIVRNCLGEAIYGISCKLDINTGAVSIDPQYIDNVKELYDKYMTYLKDIKDIKDKKTFNRYKKEIKLGYHLGLYGYDDALQEVINIDPNWNSEEEEDKEEEDKEEEETNKYGSIGLSTIFLDSSTR